MKKNWLQSSELKNINILIVIIVVSYRYRLL